MPDSKEKTYSKENINTVICCRSKRATGLVPQYPKYDSIIESKIFTQEKISYDAFKNSPLSPKKMNWFQSLDFILGFKVEIKLSREILLLISIVILLEIVVEPWQMAM